MPYPTPGWARQVHPDLSPEDALARLAEQILHVCRLDTDDPVAAWGERARVLIDKAATVTARRFKALRFDGPGTDLTVGLLPTSQVHGRASSRPSTGSSTCRTCPPRRSSARPTRSTPRASCARPSRSSSAARSSGGSRSSSAAARRCASTPTRAATCCAATRRATRAPSRLGEVALVDGDGRIGQLGTTFFDTLLDENAASHIALGESYAFTAGEEDHDRLNHSSIHIDFMIGSDDVAVTGLGEDGSETPVLRDGAWQI